MMRSNGSLREKSRKGVFREISNEFRFVSTMNRNSISLLVALLGLLLTAARGSDAAPVTPFPVPHPTLGACPRKAFCFS